MARRRRRLFARWYPGFAASLEPRGLGAYRTRLLAPLSGRVLEVGCGHGVNFPHYPEAVTELVAVEPEAHLRDLAREQAAALDRDVTVLDGRAEALPVESGSFDSVVTTLVLCSVGDLDRALAEIRRVLKPGGALVCLEHVASANRAVRAGEHAFDAVFWSHAFGGCHTGRDTGAAIARAGFEAKGLKAKRYPGLPFPLSVSPHLIGSAHKPVQL
ncbi:class I SAM-dependent methyltransferase [Glycomyces lechevalierae]|uniref:SAM-dependent methyltransferase n=1 Tax=Glycomyces lechevalierae TaxID=256034 RepID=A0A9X3PH14_9ACTN|nr:class I SAM-dependent methyltransferase [Glycomyces lechevalierae]MDA1383546.1 class I SAM-dependent methyltransferase [Glycomyces lechevalierae]MDR7341465.1 SAM-dependent methyltransferase [Glycomyces lechevalierae]